ncbi:MAG TPA: CoB--CoM heterodisulfide reductase iron-sulfur subunit A family protein [Candidatus Syntrophoarchaeum butanivorans]|uniref:CoB--CoM heterodisulfide reductase iron-sulfur subunit A n=1 Tax=Candidatus Syntropharchaeum butanivorans TaxID=1839936 RepID=A0A1F2P316_9EURY|nr:MAG: heterodisulfide reductase subunit A [Candidatus Syntrophoarchaeum butanivorans]HEC57841.1 CoB--CoM heterodisulfide reductase iron-sulfur subunit A family protein [Candidatus Syntrophoarchaeum butanivorans]
MIGVYVCHCGINIASTVDVKAVAEYASTLPGVTIARDYQYMCSDPGQELIKKDIKEYGLKRVVVASCSPRMHEITFRGVVEDAGLNPYCFEMANLREHCSWVHMDREKATEKAKDLVRSAVAKALLLAPLERREVGVTPSALVIGGGVAGLEAALDIADAGFRTYLVEREPTLGGHAAQIGRLFPTMDDASCLVVPKMMAVREHPNIEVMTDSEVVEVEGYIGNFEITVLRHPRYVDLERCTACGKCTEVCPVEVPDEFNRNLGMRKAIYLPFSAAIPPTYRIDPENCLHFKGESCSACVDVCGEDAIRLDESEEKIKLDIGTIVLATGYEPFDARLKPEFGYGKYENVVTGLDLERMLAKDGPTGGKVLVKGKEPEKIAFIQCVGSRDKQVGNEYCSRVCCMYTAKQARILREMYPDAVVKVFFMDVRAFGKGYEEFWEETQRSGVLYVRGNPSEIYRKGDRVVVRGEDTLLGEPYEEEFDLVVLATGLVPRADTREFGNLLKVSRSADGFYLEAHPKLRPVDTATDGVYLAGCCQGPKDITDTISQANGTAVKACIPLFIGKVAIEPTTSMIDSLICSGCRVCEGICAYGALKFDPEAGVMTVNEVLCKGCGSCASACPSSAISMKHFMDKQIFAQIEAIVS